MRLEEKSFAVTWGFCAQKEFDANVLAVAIKGMLRKFDKSELIFTRANGSYEYFVLSNEVCIWESCDLRRL